MERTRAAPKEGWLCRNMGNDGIAKGIGFYLVLLFVDGIVLVSND